MSPDELAGHVVGLVRNAIVDELESSKQSILSQLGGLERMVINRNWSVIEAEVPRIVQATIAEALRRIEARP